MALADMDKYNETAEALYQKGKEYDDVNDYVNAFGYYYQAAEKGHAAAQCQLGFYYRQGYGTPKNLVNAAEWFRKSAEQGYLNGLFYLGVAYKNGAGVVKNYAKATELFKKKLEYGDDAMSQLNLADMYADGGNGIEKNYEEAARWYALAAEQSDYAKEKYDKFLASGVYKKADKPKSVVEETMKKTIYKPGDEYYFDTSRLKGCSLAVEFTKKTY